MIGSNRASMRINASACAGEIVRRKRGLDVHGALHAHVRGRLSIRIGFKTFSHVAAGLVETSLLN